MCLLEIMIHGGPTILRENDSSYLSIGHVIDLVKSSLKRSVFLSTLSTSHGGNSGRYRVLDINLDHCFLGVLNIEKSDSLSRFFFSLSTSESKLILVRIPEIDVIK